MSRAKFMAICATLIPKDVQLTIGQRMPGGSAVDGSRLPRVMA
ncbi:MAG: hypothetical protein WB499_10660 [Pseudolabrys sp.]|jgi:hypothetical protein